MFNLSLNSAPKWLMGAVAVAIVAQALSGLIGTILPAPLSAEVCLSVCGGQVESFSARRCVCRDQSEETTPSSGGDAARQRRLM